MKIPAPFDSIKGIKELSVIGGDELCRGVNNETRRHALNTRFLYWTNLPNLEH